jgi:hypothetical protein
MPVHPPDIDALDSKIKTPRGPEAARGATAKNDATGCLFI